MDTDSYSYIRDQLLNIRKSSTSPADKISRLSLTKDLSLKLDDQEIPYELIELAFECLSSRRTIYTRDLVERRVEYNLLIDDQFLEYYKYSDGDFEILANGLLHCTSGPALKIGGTTCHYKLGFQHNELGPSYVSEQGEPTYHLYGEEVPFHSWIERNPQASHSFITRGDKTAEISQLQDYAVVKGYDGTIAVLRRTTDPPDSNDFLLNLIGTRLPGFKVSYYLNIGRNLLPIYDYLRKDQSDWKLEFTPTSSRLFYKNSDGTRAVLVFNHETNELIYKCRIGETFYQNRTYLGFDPLDCRNAISLFPEVKIYRDGESKLHRIDGPAVFIPNTTTQHWVHGQQTLKQHSLPVKEINYTDSTMPTYVDLNATSTEQRQTKFEEALKRVKEKAQAQNAPSNSSGAPKMEVKTIKHGEAKTTTSDTRTRQVSAGAKVGMQKAALRIGSQKLADKLVESTTDTQNPLISRIAQVGILLSSAELTERLPDSVASKVGLNEDRRQSIGGMARHVAGEQLGRDLVDIITWMGPQLFDKLQGISAEEITELTHESEQVTED